MGVKLVACTVGAVAGAERGLRSVMRSSSRDVAEVIDRANDSSVLPRFVAAESISDA